MKKLILIIAIAFIGIIAKAQEIKIESNKILSIEKLAEIKGDTLFIYKDLDKALEVLNKSKNHKPFKYVVIVKEQPKNKSGNIYYQSGGILLNGTSTLNTTYLNRLTIPNN